MRVVSHTCSNTEIVCALGCAEMLVGVDDHSDHPPEVVSQLPRIGPDLMIDIDRTGQLAPDLVLTSLTVPGHEQVVAGLAAAGLPHLVLEPRSLADVAANIRQIATALGVPERGVALANRLRDALVAGPPTHAYRPKILVEWWPKPVIAPGRDSWVTELIALAGGQNPLADRPVKSTPLTDPEVVALAPDAVVISWCGVPTEKYRTRIVTRRPAWQNLPALRTGQIHPIAEAYLGRPGPRLADGLAALRDVVRAVLQHPAVAGPHGHGATAP